MPDIQVSMYVEAADSDDAKRRATVIGEADGIEFAFLQYRDHKAWAFVRTTVTADTVGEAAVMVGDIVRKALGVERAGIADLHAKVLS